MTDLADNALTTLTAVAGEFEMAPGDSASADERWTRYINIASDLFERATSRKWYRVDGFEERVSSYGGRQLLVRHHRPIITINEIRYDDGITDIAVDDSDYVLFGADDRENGIITRIRGAWRNTSESRTEIMTHPVPSTERGLYVVNYDGGYVTPKQVDDAEFPERTLPYDIEDAVVMFAAMKDAQRGIDTSVSRIGLDRGSITYLQINGQRVSVPAAFASAVTSYRDVVVQ